MTQAKAHWDSGLPLDSYQELVTNHPPSKSLTCPENYTLGDCDISCGPLVRFLAFDEENKGNYRGSIMFVFKGLDEGKPHKVTYELTDLHHSDSATANKEGELESKIIHQELGYTFVRYSIDFQLADKEQVVKYALNDESLPHFQFVMPSKTQNMNVMSYSCNGFSLGVDTSQFKGSLWLDVLRKHDKLPYHVMIGGGDQIYADAIKISSKEFARWAKHKHLYSGKRLSEQMINSFVEFYLNHYLKWFGKGFWEGPNGKTIQVCYPIALASIPQINIYDDHDIIDGFGSYSDVTMQQEVMKGVGNYAYKYYMLFQHHTSPKEDFSKEPSFILGKTPGPYIEETSKSVFTKLGQNVAFVGLDCRTERTKKKVVNKSTYKAVFDRMQHEVKNSKTKINHLYVLLGVPIMYPRMVWVESLMESFLSRPLKFMARHGIISGGLVNEFDGEIELLDDLNDHWCAAHHKQERNWLLANLMNFAKINDVRITILSGDVHLCCVSRTRTLDVVKPEEDPNFIINLISSAIVNVPPPEGMANFLHKRAFLHKFGDNVGEDMIPFFREQEGGNELLMARRNFSDLIPIENLSPEVKIERYGSEKPNNESYIPGEGNNLVTVAEQSGVPGTNDKIGYKYQEGSVVTSIYVENDRTDVESSTERFEFFLPSLRTAHKED